MLSEHAVRGWKASEMAERSLLDGDPQQGMVLHDVPWGEYRLVLDVVGVTLLAILVGMVVLRRWEARKIFLKSQTKPGKHVAEDGLVMPYHDGKGQEECCSCSSGDGNNSQHMYDAVEDSGTFVETPQRNIVVKKTAYSEEVLSKRVQEATATLSSIHSQLPETMSRKDKVAMTHMMLEAIKVNEACKTTASMERMESITEKGVDIQSETFDMKQQQYRAKVVSEKAQQVAKMVMDIMFTGVLIMLASGGCTSWYRGILGKKTQRCVVSSSSNAFGLLFGGGRSLSNMAHVVSCYVTHLVRALQAVVVLVITPISIHKMGILNRRVEDLPICTLGATFGGICGLSGTYVVQWLGGKSMLWLAMWQIWVIACLLCLLLSSRISRKYICTTKQAGGPSHGVLVALGMWTVLALVYPMTMGIVTLI